MEDNYNTLPKTNNKYIFPYGKFICKIIFATFVFINFIFLMGLPLTYCGASDSLTPEEREWLNKHDGKIIVNNESGWPPIIDRDSTGNSFGIVMDYQRLIEKKLNFKFKLDKPDTWDNFMERFQKREIDVNNNLQKNPKREEYALFTKPYIEIPNAIIVRKEIKSTLTLEKMAGMKIAATKDFAIYDYIKTNYGQLQLIPLTSDINCLVETSTKDVDAAVVNLAVASFLIEKMGISNLRVAGYTDYKNSLCFASRKDWPILNQILNKGLDLISREEKAEIYRKWISLGAIPFYKSRNFLVVAGSIAVVIFTVFLIILLWNRNLKRLVEMRTESLEQQTDDLKKEIAGRNLAEKALNQSEVYLLTLIDSLPDLVWLKDSDGIYLACNSKFERFFGAKKTDIIGKTDYDFVNTELADFFRKNDNIAITAGKPKKNEEKVTYADDGHTELLETLKSPMYNNEGKLIGVLGVGRDITERKTAELALLENNELLTSFIRHSPIYCYIKDVSPKRSFVLQASENYLEMIGIPGSQMIGKTMEELFPAEFAAKITADDWDVISKGDLLKLDEDLNGRNFTTIKFPIVLGGKTLLAGYTIDITERKQAEAEKLMAQKISDENEKQALIGRIAGKMAHDFNNILGIIMGNAELALINCPDDETKKRLDLIYNQTIHGKNLTKNLVAFAKDQEPKQEFFSINEKMDLVLNLLKKDLDGINVIRQYGRRIPELLADTGMMEHAIVNLIQNSIHAISLVEQPEIIVRTYIQREFIFLEIEDNGCGIPPEFLGEIFESSFTLKGSKDKNGMYKPGIKGTGYGMSNVKRYIEQHKGTISIDSEVKKGTKVTIKLPVIKKELTIEEIKDIKREIIYFEKYILLVEDEQAISDIQYSILTHAPCNHKVDVANTGQMAIDLLKRNQYDLISLDYVLQGSYTGMDLYHYIRGINNAVPVLFISGNIEFLESIKDLKQKDPYIDHLSKPCKNIDYINCVNELFRNVAI